MVGGKLYWRDIEDYVDAIASGSTKDYCETGCQVGFGSCKKAPVSFTKPTVSTATGLAPSASPKQPISKNARCGAGFGGQTCQGSKWGNCCSQYFYVRHLSHLLIISRDLRRLTCAVRQQLRLLRSSVVPEGLWQMRSRAILIQLQLQLVNNYPQLCCVYHIVIQFKQ
jgi:hypothetical protein